MLNSCDAVGVSFNVILSVEVLGCSGARVQVYTGAKVQRMVVQRCRGARVYVWMHRDVQ